MVTPTAIVHERAWGELFAAYDYSADDYLAHIDGKPRYDGVRSFLASRGITLPEGDVEDPPGETTVSAMGNRKNELFNELIAAGGIEPYAGTVAVVELLERAGVPQAIVSSSKNAGAVLRAAGMQDRFPHVIDGTTALAESLAGKPDPAMFLHASHLLGAPPADAVVVEDAVAGVKAGVAGGFGLVLGINRGGNAEALADAGAHLVANDLGLTLIGADGASGLDSSSDPPLPTGTR